MLMLSLLSLLSATSFSAAVAAATDLDSAVTLQAIPQATALAQRIDSLIDDSSALDIADVRSSEVGARFRPLPPTTATGLDQRPHWYRLRLRQHTPSGAWVLALPGSPTAPSLSFYGPYDESGIARAPPVFDTPAAQPLRFLGQERSSFLIAPPGPGTYTVYLRAQAMLPQRHAWTLSDIDTFARQTADTRLLNGACYGLLFGLMVYALVMLRTFRDPIYLYFLFSIVWALWTLVLLGGHLPGSWVTALPQSAECLLLATLALWIAFGLLFGARYLNMRRHVPRLAAVVFALAAATGAAAIAIVAAGWSALAVALCRSGRRRWTGPASVWLAADGWAGLTASRADTCFHRA